MNKLKQVVFGLFFGLAIISCSDANSQVNNLNLDGFVSKINSTPKAQLIDVRTPGEWAQGKIGSSNLISIADPNFIQQASKLDKNKPVFVYCAVGGRSARASSMLQQAGFKQVYNLTGAGYSGLAQKGMK
ncbi:rhodanese-like domain-containing protein [Lacihabitans sp. LS3-19]|uniref:rhodanese-like domain-containing protein n=1 Tax=Lacihabitans sp. LS3-19 TaxID=2487335 RepID=UPI0020CC3DC6|nr:rhodanese-like domain-containing protein [Lacihabitans sp. LS3-19]MCP9769604.1 rhodanese-like domain-containing protein [Lacihabitans sp. LS3-19]